MSHPGELGIDLAIVFAGLTLYFLAIFIDSIANWNNPNQPGKVWEWDSVGTPLRVFMNTNTHTKENDNAQQSVSEGGARAGK